MRSRLAILLGILWLEIMLYIGFRYGVFDLPLAAADIVGCLLLLAGGWLVLFVTATVTKSRGRLTFFLVLVELILCILSFAGAVGTFVIRRLLLEQVTEQAEATVELYCVYLLVGTFIFMVASLVAAVLVIWQSWEISPLVREMMRLADGKEVEVKGRAHSREVRLMWNSVMELQKKLRQANYDRGQILTSCYRFMPSGIEKMLGKDSVTEVTGGDSVVREGTIAYITSAEGNTWDEDTVNRLNSFITLLDHYRQESKSFFVSGNEALNSILLLFSHERGGSVKFALSFLQEVYGKKELSVFRTGIFLCYTPYCYGVAGESSRCLPFILSEHSRQTQAFAAWFRQMGLYLVITGQIKERENFRGQSRYIGYILLDSEGEKIDLYEVLDVRSIAGQKMKISQKERFAEALELFYQHDFYLAREGFSDVYKANPADLVAQWYLFTCERYLNNEQSGEGDICCLRCEDARQS